MAPVLSERFAAVSVPGSDTSAPFSTTTLVTSIAIIVSSILGAAIVAAAAIIVISIRRRIRENLAATIAREFVPTVVVTDMTTYPHSTSVIDMDNNGPLGCKPASEKVKHSSTSPRGSTVMPIIHEENEDLDLNLEEEKAEFLVAHPDEIEEFDQTVDHRFKTTEFSEQILDVERNGQIFAPENSVDEKSDGEASMKHRDSIQLYGSQTSNGSIFRSLHKTLDDHQELTSETSRYSWESEQSSRRSDSDIPVYPGEEDIASSSFEAVPTDPKSTTVPVVLESKTFTSSAASLLKQFWQFSSQESIRRKAAMHAPISNSSLAGIFEIESQENGKHDNTTTAIESDPLDPAILKYCWHLDAQNNGSPRGSMDSETDHSATLAECVVSNSYTTSKSLDSICFIQRRSTEEMSDEANYYDIPITNNDTPESRVITPDPLGTSDSQHSFNNANSRRARMEARKSKSASILDSLYLGRQNWNKKRTAKLADKETAMREFSKIQRVAFQDFTNFPGAH